MFVVCECIYTVPFSPLSRFFFFFCSLRQEGENLFITSHNTKYYKHQTSTSVNTHTYICTCYLRLCKTSHFFWATGTVEMFFFSHCKIFIFFFHRFYILNFIFFLRGSAGSETGLQSRERKMRSASRKFRNRLATRRSCRNNRWNSSLKKKTKKKKKSIKLEKKKDGSNGFQKFISSRPSKRILMVPWTPL